MGISEQLESQIDIVDLVGKYASLKKAGTNYKCNCPFPGHNEKTPSFMVSPAKQLAYCFGCHRGGGPIKFIMDIENCEFKEALEILGNYTGIQVNTNFNEEKFQEKKNMYSLYKDAANYYKNALENYPEIKKYLFDRGLNDELIKKFDFGYADSGVELFNYLKKKGYEDEQIEASKIFLDIRTKKDKFINRIIFPIRNARGDFVAFAGRIHGKGEPKYLNSPATSYYDKSNILYNLFNARTSVTKEDYIIITEGYMDVIALNKGGFFNSVAVSGTALTEKHITLIKRLTKKVYLCFDGDGAGEKATKLSLEKMKNSGLEVKIISLPKGKDPDEIISAGKDFKEYIDNAKTPIGFYIEKSNVNINSIDEKKKSLVEMLEIIKSYSDNVEKDFYLKEVSNLLDINENIIYDAFNKIRFKRHESAENLTETKYTTSSEEILMAYCILNGNNAKYFKENILFLEDIGEDLRGILDNGIAYLDTFELSKKEKIKGIALKIEAQNEHANLEHSEEELQKVVLGLNREIYKKEETKVNNLIKSGDASALNKKVELISKAKKLGLK